MQLLEVSGAVRPINVSLSVKRLIKSQILRTYSQKRITFFIATGTGFGGLGVACWPLVPKFKTGGFFRAKKSSAHLPSEGK